MSLKLYAGIWPDGDISIVLATNKQIAAQQLDVLGDPTSIVIKQLPERFANGLMFTGSSGLYNFQTGDLIKRSLTPEEVAIEEAKEEAGNRETYVYRSYKLDGEATDIDLLEANIANCKKIVKVTTDDIYGN